MDARRSEHCKTAAFTLAGLIPGAIAVPVFVHQWGLAGSAWATVLGMAIMASLFLWELHREHVGSWRLQWGVVKRQLVLGRDLIVRSASFQVAFLSAAAVASRFGTAQLAAHQIMIQLWNFLSLVLDSLAIAAQALTGAALGARSAKHARSVGTKVTFYSTAFALGLGAVLALGIGIIPALFTTDAVVLEVIRLPWLIMIVMVVLGGVVFALDGVLLGASDAAFLRTLTVVSVLCGFLPGVWAAYALGAGLPGVWCGLALFVFIRFLGVVYRFRSMRWAVV